MPCSFSHPEANRQEARIRSALGLAEGPLPAVDRRGLAKYYEYLANRLAFPFEARSADEHGSPHSATVVLAVRALLNPADHPVDEYTGLLCRAIQDDEEREVPLLDLEVDDAQPNYQLLEDYWYWVWNWRFDPQI
jgi:hypothetical protein